MKKLTPVRLVAVLYAVGLVCWLVLATGGFLYDKGCQPLALDMEEAALSGLEGEAGGYLTTDGDPQIIFEGLGGRRARRLVLYAEFDREPGETDLYYTRSAGQGFSAGKRVWGVLQADGSWLYTLPPGRVEALRLDPGSTAWMGVEIRAIELDPPRPFSWYLAPSGRQVMALLLWPPLAACGIYTIISIWPLAKGGRRRGKARG